MSASTENMSNVDVTEGSSSNVDVTKKSSSNVDVAEGSSSNKEELTELQVEIEKMENNLTKQLEGIFELTNEKIDLGVKARQNILDIAQENYFNIEELKAKFNLVQPQSMPFTINSTTPITINTTHVIPAPINIGDTSGNIKITDEIKGTIGELIKLISDNNIIEFGNKIKDISPGNIPIINWAHMEYYKFRSKPYIKRDFNIYMGPVSKLLERFLNKQNE